MQVVQISLTDFLSKYNGAPINLVDKNFFSDTDVLNIQQIESSENDLGTKIRLFVDYLPFALTNPLFLSSFMLPRLLQLVKLKSTDIESFKARLLLKYNTLVSVTSVFNPKSILEIGTYLGIGTAAFKEGCPDATVYTMCPKINKNANNPIAEDFIGYYYKKKNLAVQQIWEDSTKFDYKTLPSIDVSFIDGNHAYAFVLSDLNNTAKITQKCVILDDYIPKDYAREYNLIFGPWNNSVVTATNTYLKANPTAFKKAYLISGTPYCLLLKE